MLSQTYFPTEHEPFSPLRHHLDVTIVFGEGPVKPLLLEEELTSEQKTIWDNYKTAPLVKEEPDFFVIERDMPSDIFDTAHEEYWQKLKGIRSDPKLAKREKIEQLKKMLLMWQHWGRFSLKGLAKQNAIAAGIALLTGLTKEVILSGGPTMPEWKREEFLHLFRMQHPELTDKEQSSEFEKQFQLFIKYFLRWPSEAQVMADMITHNFSEAYYEKTGQRIESVLHLETDSRNTLENITFTLNRFPDLLAQDNKIGFLGPNHQLERIALIAHRFQLKEAPGARISAQNVLAWTADAKQKQEIKDLFTFYQSVINPWVAKRIDAEKRWITGLTTPEYLSYWLGYTFELKDPKRIMNVLQQYSDPVWQEKMREAFEEVGVDFDRFTAVNLKKLAEEKPEAYEFLRQKMTELTHPDHRTIPSQA